MHWHLHSVVAAFRPSGLRVCEAAPADHPSEPHDDGEKRPEDADLRICGGGQITV